MIPSANKEYVLKTLQIYDTKALKKYGQKFLIDENVAKSIVDAVTSDDNSTIIEIGPGLGALTCYLLSKKGKKILIDVDEIMIEHLRRQIDDKNVEIIKQDFLKYNFDSISSNIVIVSNVPYYITTEIIERLISCNKLSQMTLMVQKEAYYRLVAEKGTKEYSPTSIFIEYLGGSKVLNKISRHAFIPEPHVDSLVFQVNVKKKRKAKDEKLFFKTTKAMFKMRRKTILNNLTQFLHEKEKAINILNKLNCSLTSRPEQLSLSFYLDLADLLFTDKQF